MQSLLYIIYTANSHIQLTTHITIFSLCFIVVICRLMWALLQTAKRHICTFVSKENLFVLRSLLKDWNYFWNKYCNLLFLAICRSQFPLLIFLASSWHQKTKIALWTSLRNKKKSCEQKGLLKKKWLIPIFKDFIK